MSERDKENERAEFAKLVIKPLDERLKQLEKEKEKRR